MLPGSAPALWFVIPKTALSSWVGWAGAAESVYTANKITWWAQSWSQLSWALITSPWGVRNPSPNLQGIPRLRASLIGEKRRKRVKERAISKVPIHSLEFRVGGNSRIQRLSQDTFPRWTGTGQAGRLSLFPCSSFPLPTRLLFPVFTFSCVFCSLPTGRQSRPRWFSCLCLASPTCFSLSTLVRMTFPRSFSSISIPSFSPFR